MVATLKDLAKVLIAKHQLKQRDAELFVNAVVDTILEGLQNDRVVKVKGFGTFKLTAVRDRESVNVNTGERIVVSGHDKISFSPDSTMRDMVNKPFAHFDTVVLADGVTFDDVTEIENETENLLPDVEVETEENVNSLDRMISEDVKDTINESKEEIKDMPNNEMLKEEEHVANEPVSAIEEPVSAVEEPVSVVKEPATPVIDEPIVPAVEEPTVEGPVAEEPVIEEPLVKAPVIEKALAADAEEEKEVAESHKHKSISMDDDDDMDDEDDNDKEDCKKIFILYAIITNILIAAIAFVLGYMCCSNKWIQFGPTTELVPEMEPEEIEVDSVQLAEIARIDSLKKAAEGPGVKKADTEKKNNEEAATDKKVAETPKNKPAEKENTEKKAPEQKETNAKQTSAETTKSVAGIPDQTPYLNNARVRTGAYYIIGTQATVTVRPGQTLQSISKFYLGEGMECYVEAYNGGITSVNEGQSLKIPKLKLKKSLKK